MHRHAASYEQHPHDATGELIAAIAVKQTLYGRRQPAAVHVVAQALAAGTAVGGDLFKAADALLDRGIGVAQHPYAVALAAPELDPFVAAVMQFGSPPAGGTLLLRTKLQTPSGQRARGLALDAVAPLLVAEDMRGLLSCDRIVHVVDDTDDDGLVPVAIAAVNRLRTAGEALQLRGYEVLRTSETGAKAGRLLRREVRRRGVAADLQEEVAQQEALHRAYDVTTTVGWTRARHLASIDSYLDDERRVDRAHQMAFGPDLTRIYATPGFAEDPGRSQVNPYAWVPEERRMSLDPASVGVALPLSAGMRRHLLRLAARLETRLGIPPPGVGLMDRVTGLRLRVAR